MDTGRYLIVARSLLAAAAALVMAANAAALFTPLNDLASGLYLDQFEGGLYPNGSNDPPASHAAEGLRRAAAVEPRNTLGEADPDGKYVLLSIGMSNTTQEFCSGNTPTTCQSWSFMGQAAAHPDVDHTSLFIANGALGGKSAAFWDEPTDPDYDRVVDDWLTPYGLSEQQVEVAWVKVANPGPTVSLPDEGADAYRLVEQMGNIARTLKVRYPHLEQVYFSSRIYAGYATTTLNPEPYAYESGLAVKWLIEAQIDQMNGGNVDPIAGDLDYTSGVAPWIAWGPYLWANGLNPRSDGLVWEQDDFTNDGTHPSTSGREKVGTMLLDFMLDSPFAQPWFLRPVPGDYNGNGVVDAADYTTWRDHLRQSFTLTNENPVATTPGLVDAEDYAFWKSHFGESLGGGADADVAPGDSPGANYAAPEPATCALLLLACLMTPALARRCAA